MAISVQKAIDLISNININTNYEIIPIENSIARISAKAVYATSYLPKFDNSAMDGYAIIYENKDNEIKIIDTIFAGDNNEKLLKENSCIKIMTGARIPANATAIIPKEDTQELNDNKIKIKQNVKKFQHIRYIGEDIKKDDLLVDKGDEINFSKITLLASQGISHIQVFRKPKIVVFASGEELKLHYEKIEDYQIYNSNTPTFIARAQELACDVRFIGQAKDTIEDIKNLTLNCFDADLIITSGGVSVGDADFTKEAFNQLDFETIFEGITVKPGKPTIFGKIKNTYVLNLPGNPLAASLIFEVFGKTLIQKLLASNEIHPNFILAKLDNDFQTRKGRITILPGMFDGEYFKIAQNRSPGMVSVLSTCNSMIIIDDEIENLQKDSLVKVLPINWKFFSKIKKDFITHG